MTSRPLSRRNSLRIQTHMTSMVKELLRNHQPLDGNSPRRNTKYIPHTPVTRFEQVKRNSQHRQKGFISFLISLTIHDCMAHKGDMKLQKGLIILL